MKIQKLTFEREKVMTKTTIFSAKNSDYYVEFNENKEISTALLKSAIKQTQDPRVMKEFKNNEDIDSLLDKLYSFNIEHTYADWLITYAKPALTLKKDGSLPDRAFWKKHKYQKLDTLNKVVTENPVTLITDKEKMSKNYTVVDVETTGLNTEIDAVIQFSAVKYENFKPVDQLNIYIKPSNGENIKAETTAITGITQEDVDSGSTFKDAFNQINQFLDTSFLVGHNLNFDINILHTEYKRLNKELPKIKYSDTLKIAKSTLPFLPRGGYKLENLKKRLPKEYNQLQSHDSLNDCFITGDLYQYLLNIK